MWRRSACMIGRNLGLKANVFIGCTAPVATRIKSINIITPSWTADASVDNRSGMRAPQVLGLTILNFVKNQGTAGKIYVFQCRLSDNVEYSAVNSISELLLFNSDLQRDLIQAGGDSV